MFYSLDDNHAVVPCSQEAAIEAFGSDRRVVRQSTVGPYLVSTVFLVIDHNLGTTGTPVLFETMVFLGGEGGAMERTCSWEQAEEAHRRMVRKHSGPTVKLIGYIRRWLR